MSTRIYVESMLPCPPHSVWDEVQRSELLQEMISFSADGEVLLPKTWQHGSTVRICCWLFGLIRLPTRTLFCERVDNGYRQIQTRERDRLIRRWDYLISICVREDGTTLNSNTVEIDAGILTLPVWLFALWLYRHRQNRMVSLYLFMIQGLSENLGSRQ